METQAIVGQLYTLPLTDENRSEAMPGQFVFHSNASDQVIGFVSSVNYATNNFEICLFAPTELSATAVVIRDTVEMDEVAARLKDITDQDPVLHNLWVQLIAGSPTLQ